MKIITIFKKHKEILILLLFVFAIFVLNYKPGTYLTGWDNLHPEFDFKTNIERSVFAVWQEYQGLGLLGGMGHASDLVHQLFLLIVSTVLPLSLLRYFWTFLMLFIGGTGVYFLLKNLILKEVQTSNSKQRGTATNSPQEWNSPDTSLYNSKFAIRKFDNLQLISLLGGLFYLLNLATVQTFYAPFEAFIAHFGFLPWLLYFSLKYWLTGQKKGEIKNLIYLSLTLFIATPASYIPTLFLVYIMALTVLVVTLSINNLTPEKASLPADRIKKSIKLYLAIFVVNSFWLLPFIYFTITNSSVNLNAKMNLMATDVIYLQNKEFGSLQDSILLKGFWFNNVDPNLEGNFDYMLKPWREHLEKPVIMFLGYFLFSVVIFGLIYSLRTKKPIYLSFSALFIFALSMIITTTWPFSSIHEFLRNNIPLFHQAFRFPFTKFSILNALTYSVFFSIGVYKIIDLSRKTLSASFFNTSQSAIKSLPNRIAVFFIFVIIVFNFPTFRGQFLYNKEKADIPKEYFQVFEFFKNQDPNTRIANFPQHTFWGWSFYNWGYGGSGFLWYGIKQPIIDRAFDVWSATSENYYYEISHALYTKDVQVFEKVLNKYQINWLLVDKNVYNPFSPKSIFIPELTELLTQEQNITLVKSFGNIDIYKVSLKDNVKNFVYFDNNLPAINSYEWGQSDQAYINHENYISVPDTEITNSQLDNLTIRNYDYFYPFRTLFSDRGEKSQDYSINEEKNFLMLHKRLPANKNFYLHIPSYLEKEDSIPVEIKTSLDSSSNLVINFVILTPEVIIDGNKIWGDKIEQSLFEITQPNFPLNLNINGVKDITIQNSNASYYTFLVKDQNNIFTLSNKNTNASQSKKIIPEFFHSLDIFDAKNIEFNNSNSSLLSIKFPKINDYYLGFDFDLKKREAVENCDRFRKGMILEKNIGGSFELISKNSAACIVFYVPTPIHKQGYIVFFEGKHIKGKDLHLWILNEDEQYSPIDIYLSRDFQEKYTSDIILPPMESYGKAYSIHLDNISIGNDETINRIDRLSIYPIPYNFATSLILSEKEELNVKKEEKTSNYDVLYSNTSKYIVTNLSMDQSNTLILSQSFDVGWKVYRVKSQESRVKDWLNKNFPFIFGKEIGDHVLVNNWENGWLLDNYTLNANRYTLVILYLPQYLEYIGFLLLIGYFGYLTYLRFRTEKQLN